MNMGMVSLDEFESVMIRLAEAEGWTFRDGDEDVAPESVFNNETYGPALLYAAQSELEARGLPVDLEVDYETRTEAMLGVAAVSRPSASFLAATWRLCVTAFVVEHLPRHGAAMDLSILRGVFPQDLAPRTAA